MDLGIRSLAQRERKQGTRRNKWLVVVRAFDTQSVRMGFWNGRLDRF